MLIFGCTRTHTPDPAEVETVHSDITGDDFTVHIMQPAGDGPFPVAYYLDGEFQPSWRFEVPDSATLPPMITVGIGYGADGRNQDYIWPEDPTLEGTGGGDLFYEFLRDELIPYIDATRPRDPNEPNVLQGHSFGGYFRSAQLGVCQQVSGGYQSE